MSIDDPYLNSNAIEYFLNGGEFDDFFEYTKHPELQEKSTKVRV